jgi:hypothetical protein
MSDGTSHLRCEEKCGERQKEEKWKKKLVRKKKHQILVKYQGGIGHDQMFYTVVCTEGLSG